MFMTGLPVICEQTGQVALFPRGVAEYETSYWKNVLDLKGTSLVIRKFVGGQ